jgi:hypothetical protein
MSKVKVLKNTKIEDCQQGCNGKPNKIDFEVHNFKGKRCEQCYLVLEYKRVDNANNKAN